MRDDGRQPFSREAIKALPSEGTPGGPIPLEQLRGPYGGAVRDAGDVAEPPQRDLAPGGVRPAAGGGAARLSDLCRPEPRLVPAVSPGIAARRRRRRPRHPARPRLRDRHPALAPEAGGSGDARLGAATIAVSPSSSSSLKAQPTIRASGSAPGSLGGLLTLASPRASFSAANIRRWARNGVMERRAVIVGGGEARGSADPRPRDAGRQRHPHLRHLRRPRRPPLAADRRRLSQARQHRANSSSSRASPRSTC